MTIALGCIAAAYLLVFLPRVFVMAGQAKRPEGYDNANPRDQQQKLEGWARRAHAAHNNAFEGFAPFAAAVLVAHVAGADAGWTNQLAIAYCGLRVLYTLAYVGDFAAVRSLVWLASFGATIALFALPLFT